MARVLSITFIVLALNMLPRVVISAEYFLRSTANEEVANVGVPFSLTIQFYYDTCCIRAPSFSEIEISGADVSDRTNPEQFEEVINGTQFGVYKFSYTITPNRQGTLIIPKITMTGEVLEPPKIFVPADEVLPKIAIEAQALTVQVIE